MLEDGTLSIKDIARQAATISGVSRSEAYNMALKLRNNAQHSLPPGVL
jgi:hypothetical protein